MNRLLLIVLAGLVGLSTSCTAKPTASASLATEPSAESTTLSAELNDTAATPAIESKSMDAEQGAAASPLNVSDKTTSQLTIVAWNVESGGADPKVISQRLATFHADIYGLSEVHPNDFETFRTAVGEGYDEIHLAMGNDDRLELIYSAKRFELLERIELSKHEEHVLNNGGHRSPLAARLRDREAGRDYLVMVNHLARGNEAFRNQQAIGLREWARDQSVPCICVGDFNMDYEFNPPKGNQAFVEMLSDNVWSWVKPKD